MDAVVDVFIVKFKKLFDYELAAVSAYGTIVTARQPYYLSCVNLVNFVFLSHLSVAIHASSQHSICYIL